MKRQNERGDEVKKVEGKKVRKRQKKEKKTVGIETKVKKIEIRKMRGKEERRRN